MSAHRTRDRYHRLEFASAFGAVMRRWLARDGLLDVLLVRVDALRRQRTCVHSLAAQR
jgi:hypothetical protein